MPVAVKLVTLLALGNLVDLGLKIFIENYFHSRRKKQDEKISYNFGLHSDIDYSDLPKKMKSPPLKEAFEKGRKAQKK